MRCDELMEVFEQLCPVSFAANWDNPGLLAGRWDKEIKKVLLALDATSDVIDKAVEIHADLVLTHHPLIFKGVKSVNSSDYVGKRLYQLIRNDICYIAMHTNFDIMGMADAAADELALKDREVLEITYEDELSKEGFGRIGKLPRIMTLEECAQYVKSCFDIQKVKVFGNPEQDVEKAAILPGSGKSMIDEAVELGADVLITGDIDHHDGIDAVEKGITVIDAGHYGIEKIFIPYMAEYLGREVPFLEVVSYEKKEPFWYI